MMTENTTYEADARAIEPVNAEDEIKAIKNILPEEEAMELAEIQQQVLKSYSDSAGKMSVEEWLPYELQKQLPQKDAGEIKEISGDILYSLKETEKMRKAQLAANAVGRSSDSWLKSELLKGTSAMSQIERAKYLDGIDKAIRQANAEMAKTICTSTGSVSMNPNLDGFIAEQQHTNSFNINARAAGNSGNYAEVLQPKPGQTYAKNSVDIVIKDSGGKIIRRYQAKFGATAKDTIKLIKEGDYRGQQLVVPEDQLKEVQEAFPDRKISSTISDGKTESKPLKKEDVKELQKEAQADKNLLERDWSSIDTKALAAGIGKEVGKAGLMGMAIGGGMEIAGKIFEGKEVKGDEVIEKAVESGADFGVKAASTCALKAASEKGIIQCIPKGTPASTLANIAFVAVENVKILGTVASGKMSVKEGLSAASDVTCSAVGGIAAAAKGTAIGAKIGAVLGPVGAAVGGFIGGTVGYATGSKFGKEVSKAAKKVCSTAKKIVKSVVETAGEVVSVVADVIKAPFKLLGSLFS